MIARRSLTALVATAVAGLGVTTLAAPAQADTTLTLSGPITFDSDTKTWSGGTFSPTSVAGTTVQIVISATTETDEFFIFADGKITDITDEEPRVCVSQSSSADWCYLERGDTHTYAVDPSASNQAITVAAGYGPQSGEELINGSFSVSYPTTPTPDSGGAGSSSAQSVLLQALDLFGGDWMPADESSLVGWEKTVPVNTWQALPESGDVVGVGENEGKVFLGVATTPEFPVAIAQRQVDNGWGAYQRFDENGEVASVFIPAGGSMFVWTQPRLYSVWGTP